jgi:ribosome assembly protein SQT1
MDSKDDAFSEVRGESNKLKNSHQLKDFIPEADVQEVIEDGGDDGMADQHEMSGDEMEEAIAEEEEEEGEEGNPEDDDMMELQDDSVQGFFSHGEEPVYAVATHPIDPTIVCSGGGDDTAYLWRCDTGETLFKLDGHADSVVSVCFSHDGRFIATGAMDGVIKVSTVANGQLVATLEGPDEIVVYRIF